MQIEDGAVAPARMTENDVRQWTMFMHLSLLVSFMFPVVGVLFPAAMWLVRKGGAERVDRDGVMLVNAALTYHGAMVVTFALSFYLLGMLPFVLLVAALVVLPVLGAIKANEAEPWRYPLVREFLRSPAAVEVAVHEVETDARSAA